MDAGATGILDSGFGVWEAWRFGMVNMVIGVLQVELLIGDAASLKDKRRVVSSLLDRLHKNNALAVAEVDALEVHQIARLGIVTVSNSGRHTQAVLDTVVEQLRGNPKFVLNDHRVEILTGQ